MSTWGPPVAGRCRGHRRAYPSRLALHVVVAAAAGSASSPSLPSSVSLPMSPAGVSLPASPIRRSSPSAPATHVIAPGADQDVRAAVTEQRVVPETAKHLFDILGYGSLSPVAPSLPDSARLTLTGAPRAAYLAVSAPGPAVQGVGAPTADEPVVAVATCEQFGRRGRRPGVVVDAAEYGFEVGAASSSSPARPVVRTRRRERHATGGGDRSSRACRRLLRHSSHRLPDAGSRVSRRPRRRCRPALDVVLPASPTSESSSGPPRSWSFPSPPTRRSPPSPPFKVSVPTAVEKSPPVATDEMVGPVVGRGAVIAPERVVVAASDQHLDVGHDPSVSVAVQTILVRARTRRSADAVERGSRPLRAALVGDRVLALATFEDIRAEAAVQHVVAAAAVEAVRARAARPAGRAVERIGVVADQHVVVRGCR